MPNGSARHSPAILASRPKPEARFLAYLSIQPDWWDSVDLAEALHPAARHLGHERRRPSCAVRRPAAPARPRQLGYKSVKFLTRITVTDSMKCFGKGLGSASPEGGYAWYAGI